MTLFRDRPELVNGFRRGAPEALERVYLAYADQVRDYLTALARKAPRLRRAEPELVADLLQEVFVRAFSAQARLTFDPARAYGPYVRSIARNCFIDALRSGDRELLDAGSPPEHEVEERGQDERLCDPKLRSILRRYLERLPAPLWLVYEQRYVLEHSQEAACAALGLTRTELRTNEQRLRRGLREALQAQGVLPSDLAV